MYLSILKMMYICFLLQREKYMVSDIENFIYIGLRSGIGSAIFYHGRLIEGRQGNAGFIGHTTVNPEGPLCTCGNVDAWMHLQVKWR